MQEGATEGSGKATPSGVFDWTQSGQSGAWGDPNQRFRNIQKDIPKTLLAYVCLRLRPPQLSALPLSFAEFVLCLASSGIKDYTMNQIGKMRFYKCTML